jgi:hypothetical protein
MAQAYERPALPHLIRDIGSDIAALVRDEMALAKAELTEKTLRVGRDVASMAVAGGILFAAAWALLLAAIAGLSALLAQFLPLAIAIWLGPLLLGIGLGLYGYRRYQSARRALASEHLALSATAATLKENKRWILSRTH